MHRVVKQPGSASSAGIKAHPTLRVAILSGGRDKPYALGITAALTSIGMEVDFIGGDEFDLPVLRENPRVKYLNLRGDQEAAPLLRKMVRVLRYYWRLIVYAATAQPRIFHILWNNKFELFDRTLLMAYYKLLGKRLIFTAHNVNTRQRDANDSWLNRISLRAQYRLSDHIFIHTERMRKQLVEDFEVPVGKTTIIPFGLNSTVPDTDLTTEAARARIGLAPDEKALLCFGNIAPYKGLEFVVEAFARLRRQSPGYRLVIVGYPKDGCKSYWDDVRRRLDVTGAIEGTILRLEYIPDEESEVYFKAADVLVLPYTHIFQSGVLFLGYNFGLPAIAADVGSLRDEIVEGRTGLITSPCDPADLAAKIEQYFASDLYRNLATRRADIRAFARERYSWSKVARMTEDVYRSLEPKMLNAQAVSCSAEEESALA